MPENKKHINLMCLSAQLCTTKWESSYDIEFGKKRKKVATKNINLFDNEQEKTSKKLL